MFKFPDGVVRAFRHLTSEWALYDLYIASRRPGLHQALIGDIFALTLDMSKQGDHLSFEKRLQASARQAFIDLPLRKMLQQGLPANDWRNERYIRKMS